MLLLSCNMMSALRDVGMGEDEEKKEEEKEIEEVNEHVSKGNIVVLAAIAWSPGLACIEAT